MSAVADVIHRTVGGPVTVDRLKEDLARLGVRAGDVLLVHSSLSSLGYVPGSAQAVLEALVSVSGSTGTVTVPTFTGQLSDPANWSNPPVPKSWFDAIRSRMTAFDPARTPGYRMGAISEQVRTTPGAARSAHPHVSFAALGHESHNIIEPHPIEVWLGEGSPLQRLYDRDAKVLFLGTTYETCTAFHLAEHRAAKLRFMRNGAPVRVGPS